MFDRFNTFIIRLFVNTLIFIVIIVLGVFLLNRWLNNYTQHGVEVSVPNIQGLYPEEAGPMLENIGIRLKVIDSTFSHRFPLGSIVEQNPLPHSHIKNGRQVYVILNAKQRPKIKLPNLINLSYRQAISILHSLKLEMAAPRFQASQYRNLVLDVFDGNTPLQEGDLIEEGSRITLVIGKGSENRLVPTPKLIGKTLEEAKVILLQHFLNYDTIGVYDLSKKSMTERITVFDQSPYPGSPIYEGGNVSLKLTNDTAFYHDIVTIKEEEEVESEHFF